MRDETRAVAQRPASRSPEACSAAMRARQSLGEGMTASAGAAAATGQRPAAGHPMARCARRMHPLLPGPTGPRGRETLAAPGGRRRGSRLCRGARRCGRLCCLTCFRGQAILRCWWASARRRDGRVGLGCPLDAGGDRNGSSSDHLHKDEGEASDTRGRRERLPVRPHARRAGTPVPALAGASRRVRRRESWRRVGPAFVARHAAPRSVYRGIAGVLVASSLVGHCRSFQRSAQPAIGITQPALDGLGRHTASPAISASDNPASTCSRNASRCAAGTPARAATSRVPPGCRSPARGGRCNPRARPRRADRRAPGRRPRRPVTRTARRAVPANDPRDGDAPACTATS